jgi:hypothetical protein
MFGMAVWAAVAARGGVGALGGVAARGGVGALVPSAGMPVEFCHRLLLRRSSRPQLYVVSGCYLYRR